jgi:muramoyltetrapeptide carboxypeptidase
VDLKETGADIISQGSTEGILLGGCLSLVACQLGSDYMPEFENSILFIEDIGENPYKIDRYLSQLKQAGILNRIKGAILGEFIDCDPEPDDKDSFPVQDILLDYFESLSIPVLANFPYGHGMKKISMPLGLPVSFDTNKAQLRFSNPFYRLV